MLIVSLEMLLVFNHKPVDGDKRSVRLLFARPRLNKLLFVHEPKPRGYLFQRGSLTAMFCRCIALSHEGECG
ncbi:hypothetical protein GC090_06920 [Pantoea sp. JZ29]|uniref:hypothetical protein n=1 Tax=Pantoea sp. JZ29 TaxID=2654192 RepID=UPI002B491DB4|nr:hypothetical protein [Pantoea sp. JZ29]WRH20417.1 hypothetical protein GC090_06920 [Pantoea sp. JZ29]